MAAPHVAQLNELPALPCPCGRTQRAFAQPGQFEASVHLVEIHENAQAHYHRRTTEIYVVLEGTGAIELDGRVFPVKPLTAVYIPPGCRHRALGKLRLLNVPIPAFDPSDEYSTEPPSLPPSPTGDTAGGRVRV